MDYIKIPRNIIEQKWYKDISTNLVYLHLLFEADEIGTVLVSSRRLANLLGLSRQNVRTAFEKLVRWGMIETRVTQQLTQSVTHRTTEITICNYDSYIMEDLQDNPTINPISNPINPTNPTNPEEKNKTKKEEIPPHPPIEEKNKTKKEDFTENQRFSTHKNVRVCVCEGQDGISGQAEVKAPPKAPLTIDERKEEFRKTITPYEEKYGKEMCENFFNYWSEYNRSRTKMRCELQKTWQLSGRLATWAKNDYRVNQPSTVYGNTTNSRYSSADNAERERLERQRSAYRLMQRLAAEDGGDPLPPLEQ